MRRVLLLLTHLCSGSGFLYESLDRHPCIQGFRGDSMYGSPQDLVTLASRDHKADHTAAVFMDELVYNFQLGNRRVYSECRCAFILRDPGDALGEIAETRGCSIAAAGAYYDMRLRRLGAVAARNPEAVFLTFADLQAGRGGEEIRDYLRLREPVEVSPAYGMGLEAVVPAGILKASTEVFERTLYRFKGLGMRAPA